MKAYLLQHAEGEYDDYRETTEAVFLVPDDFVPDIAYRLYWNTVRDAHPEWRFRRDGTLYQADMAKLRREVGLGWPTWLKAQGYESVAFEEHLV